MDLARESDAQFTDVWTRLAQHLPGGVCAGLGGIEAHFCGAPHPVLNHFLLTRPVKDANDLAGRLERAREFAQPLGLPYELPLAEHLLGPAAAAMPDLGYRPDIELFGMRAPEVIPAPPHEELRLEPVTDARVRDAFASVHIAASGLSDAEASVLREPAIWEEGLFRGFVGFAGGAPAVAAAAAGCRNASYLALLATAPEFRRRGFAAAALRAAAPSGEAWLHATRQGFSLYRSLGFQPAASYRCYVPLASAPAGALQREG